MSRLRRSHNLQILAVSRISISITTCLEGEDAKYLWLSPVNTCVSLANCKITGNTVCIRLLSLLTNWSYSKTFVSKVNLLSHIIESPGRASVKSAPKCQDHCILTIAGFAFHCIRMTVIPPAIAPHTPSPNAKNNKKTHVLLRSFLRVKITSLTNLSLVIDQKFRSCRV